MKQHMSDFINRTELQKFIDETMRHPWTDATKLEEIAKYINSDIGTASPGTVKCECSACRGLIEHDSVYCRHCGAKVNKNSMKQRFMLLIDQMPAHEGKSFEEALAEWLIENGATLPEK